MSMTDLDISTLLSLLDMKDSNQESNSCNNSSYHSLNEQMLHRLQKNSFVNQPFPLNGGISARTEGRKLVGSLSLDDQSTSMSFNSSLTSPMTPSTTGYSAVLSCLGLQSESMFPFSSNESNNNPAYDDQQGNGHRRLDRSASEPASRSLAAALSSAKANSSNSGGGSGSGSGGNSPTGNSSFCRYKTELCRPFEENGSCKYGDKCQFAHGRHELRSLARHPKYKTDLCKTYHTTGLCPYGPRCHFIHNDEERQLNIVNRLVLEQKKTQAMYEQQRTQLVRQQQVIAAAVAAQKLLQQQQQQQQQHPNLMKQMSVDAAIQQCYRSALQLQQQSTTVSLPARASVGSPSDSPSSSITDSPSTSPTSLMFDDPATSVAMASINLSNSQVRLPSNGCWSPTEETTPSYSSDALQTVLESLLKRNAAASHARPSFREYIGSPAENNFSCLQAASYLQ